MLNKLIFGLKMEQKTTKTKYMKNIKLLFLLFIFIFSNSFSQDLDDLLDAELGSQNNYTTATFKSTHIINSHSVAQMKKKHLNFIIYHRFGAISGGIDQFFGIDNANMRLGFEYSITDWLTVGIGRSNFEKTYDGFVKARILRQSSGGKSSMPITLSYLVSSEVFTRSFIDQNRDNLFSSRLSYVHQLLIARKFNEKLSLQFMPTVIHKNLVKSIDDSNDIFGLGVGGRYKLTKRMALTFEYYPTFRNNSENTKYNDALSIGLDIETGGHVFQLMLSNSALMQEGGYIYGVNNDDFFKGDIHLGFNITRVFSFNHNK